MAPSKRTATVNGVTSVAEHAGPTATRSLASASSTVVDEETFVSLERLSRKASNDSLGARGGHLAEDQFDSLAVHLLGIGIRAFGRFDAALTISDRDGFSFAYREMRGYRQGRFTEGPYIDWLRTNVRDSRFEPEGSTSVTDTGELPEDSQPVLAGSSFEQAILEASAKLTNRALWTLHHLARPMAEEGTSLVTLARAEGVPIGEARSLLEELESELAQSANRIQEAA